MSYQPHWTLDTMCACGHTLEWHYRTQDLPCGDCKCNEFRESMNEHKNATQYLIGNEHYTLDELTEIGRKQSLENATCGLPVEARKFLTKEWIEALEEHQALPTSAALELKSRLLGLLQDEGK